MHGVKIHRHWKYTYVASQRLFCTGTRVIPYGNSGHDNCSLCMFAASCFTRVEITTILAASSGSFDPLLIVSHSLWELGN